MTAEHGRCPCPGPSARLQVGSLWARRKRKGHGHRPARLKRLRAAPARGQRLPRRAAARQGGGTHGRLVAGRSSRCPGCTVASPAGRQWPPEPGGAAAAAASRSSPRRQGHHRPARLGPFRHGPSPPPLLPAGSDRGAAPAALPPGMRRGQPLAWADALQRETTLRSGCGWPGESQRSSRTRNATPLTLADSKLVHALRASAVACLVRFAQAGGLVSPSCRWGGE